jgi:hypothetical protein
MLAEGLHIARAGSGSARCYGCRRHPSNMVDRGRRRSGPVAVTSTRIGNPGPERT